MAEIGLAGWLQRLEALHPTEIELGLERVEQVARRLDLLSPEVPVVTVAGTNGKGTTAAALEALLLAAGRRPGVYTSPHLLRFNERIRVAGEESDDGGIVAAFTEIEAARGATSLTYFEFATLAALWLFREHGCDVLVLEVGLGGRLDAVNIIDPSVAIITSIGLDHEQWLGQGLDAIGREKAGILRRDRPAVIAVDAVPDGLREAVAGSGARALYIGRDFHCETGAGGWRAQLAADASGRPPPVLEWVPLGALVPSNLCAALQAAHLLGFDLAALAIPALFSQLAPPGRRQCLTTAGIEYVLDVAHNPQAVNSLRDYLLLTNCNKKVFSVFSAMYDKDIPAIIKGLKGLFSGWFVADQPANSRAARAVDLAAELARAGETLLGTASSVPLALEQAREVVTAGDRIVVFGSFFTVAAALPSLEGRTYGGKQ